jgi:hypothetical protein
MLRTVAVVVHFLKMRHLQEHQTKVLKCCYCSYHPGRWHGRRIGNADGRELKLGWRGGPQRYDIHKHERLPVTY